MMDFNVTGNERKRLVKKLEALTGEQARYQGMPSMAFVVGDFTVSKTGQVTGAELPQDFISALSRAGFAGVGGQPEEEEKPKGVTVEISMAELSEVAVENFKNMAASKAELIKQAFGVQEMKPVEVGKTALTVRWFEDAPDIRYAEDFVRAMLNRAKVQKYVSAKPLATDNPKYSFRVFLNALGFKGAEYKEMRRDLLANLSGSSAWRHGKPGSAT